MNYILLYHIDWDAGYQRGRTAKWVLVLIDTDQSNIMAIESSDTYSRTFNFLFAFDNSKTSTVSSVYLPLIMGTMETKMQLVACSYAVPSLLNLLINHHRTGTCYSKEGSS